MRAIFLLVIDLTNRISGSSFFRLKRVGERGELVAGEPLRQL
ncbi:MAG TPA: hypothetical protein VD835_05530 [Pyrinomonadaceae bacterium]|nr:hypothetical protein [Pyrinomonadaceae bacterium]